jgi:hypothetical protein
LLATTKKKICAIVMNDARAEYADQAFLTVTQMSTQHGIRVRRWVDFYRTMPAPPR